MPFQGLCLRASLLRKLPGDLKGQKGIQEEIKGLHCGVESVPST